MRLMRRAVVAATLTLGLVLTSSSAVLARGNAAAAHRCQMGGWASLQDSSGSGFPDQSTCVSYAAGGGALFHPTFTVSTATGTGTFNGRLCCWYTFDLAGTGFHANSAITLHWVYSTAPYSDNEYTYAGNFSTDSTGAFVDNGHWHQNCLVGGDVVSGTLTATDASGVSASASFTGTCNTYTT